jgi:glucan-binding YG repeat protein
LNGSGQMYENTWYKEEEQWYYLKAGGYMARNELLKIGNEKFAFLDSGRMVRTNARGALV